MSVETTHPTKAQVLIVDDHPLLREGLVQFLNRQDDLTCCGEAEDAAGAETAIVRLKPDLVLLDLRLGSGDGLEFIKSLKARYENLRILVLSQQDELLFAERCIAAGAAGYIMKQEATREVLNAVRAVLQGELYISRKLSARLLKKMIETRPASSRTGLEKLTDRELQVFQLLASGLKNREIASELHLSVKTIETYRENLKNKLGLQNSAQLLRYATDWVNGTPASSST
jgi:DNA-binding NarL/FixJ family response regulator